MTGTHAGPIPAAQMDDVFSTVRNSNLSASHKITRSATIVIAGADCSAKSKIQADYVCDGVDDQEEIIAAIEALPATGTRTVKLMGSFVKSSFDPITVPSNTNIELDGSITLDVVADGAVMFAATDATGISITGGRLDGNATNQSPGYRTVILLTNVSNSRIDTYMTNVSVAADNAPATINGAYVKQVGRCYGNTIVNRKFPNILNVVPAYSPMNQNSEQLLLSNCDTGWQLGSNASYSTVEGTYLTNGKSLKMAYNSARSEFQFPEAVDFRRCILHVLVKFDEVPTGSTTLKATFMTDSITNRTGDEMRLTNNAIAGRWMHLTFHPGQPSAWYDTSGAFNEARVNRLGLQFLSTNGNAYVDRVWYTHNSMPIISFSFDDCWKEAWDTYGAVLRKYGLSGVWGFNPGMSIPSNFMSLADLRDAHDCGHEIINHTWNHRALSYNSAASCEDQAFAGQDFLVSNGFTDGARFLLLCYTGQMSTEGFDALRNHMYFPSTIQRINPIPELPYPYLFRYAPASVAAWQTAVDEVIKRGGWLIYYTHTPSMAGSPTVEDFELMVQYVVSKKLRVATFSEVIDVYSRVPVDYSKRFGSAKITAGQTSVNVTHGMPREPANVILSPTTSTAGKQYHVSAKTSTMFTISIDSTAGADISFDWLATL